jgi:DNA-binding IclR family transcriptional regulator
MMLTNDRIKKSDSSAPPALNRGLDVLEILEDASEPVSHGELQRRSATPPASFGRILRLLVERGYVSREVDGGYTLGWRAGAMGLSAMQRTGVHSVCQPHLEEIARVTEESSEAVEFHGHEFLFVERVESPRSVILRARPGRRHRGTDGNAIGLLMLAYGRAPAAKHSRASLDSIARAGFAELLQNNEEVYRGAAAVFDGGGECVGALCVAAPAFRVGKAEKKRYRSLLLEHAAAASQKLGYRADKTR